MSILNQLLALHDPNATSNHMVYSVWEDGEVTIEKGGDLYGQRNCHMLTPGCGRTLVPVESLPLKNAAQTHGFIATTKWEVAVAARNLMLSL